MPIKRRLNKDERLDRSIGEQWRDAFHHPLLSGIVRFDNYDATAENVTLAIKNVTSWKTKNYKDKVVVFLLASLVYRSTGNSFLSDANYDRLKKHLLDKADEILGQAGLLYHGPLLWDAPKLSMYAPGKLVLPREPGWKPPRKKLKKHK